MSLHLLKLAVGIESLSDLAARQAQRLSERVARNQTPELIHVTRHMPKRVEELLDGGSIYWVIKGSIAGRQRLLEFRALPRDGMARDGMAQCGILYDRKIVPVIRRPHRAFQGWRYLAIKDAPRDLAKVSKGAAAMPESMRRELRELGLM